MVMHCFDPKVRVVLFIPAAVRSDVIQVFLHVSTIKWSKSELCAVWLYTHIVFHGFWESWKSWEAEGREGEQQQKRCGKTGENSEISATQVN